MNIITNGGTDRRLKICRCSQCGIVRKCEPHFDFYAKQETSEHLLRCQRCAEKDWAEHLRLKELSAKGENQN